MHANASEDKLVQRSEAGQRGAHSFDRYHPIKSKYCRPTVTALGDVRDLTLGPTRGLGESGDPLTYWNHI